jgi:catechol 2,3-dioxygenase-like lactoylglutathione lyase family enzyme
MLLFSARRLPLAALALAALFGTTAGAQEVGHLHHVHLNVSDIDKTTEFYQRIFGAVPIKYNAKVPALLLERSFLFMNRMEAGKIVNHQLTGLTHVSWSAIDGKHEYEWLKSQGVDFYTPVSELLPGSTYMYLYGPDREVIELFDYQRHHRFNHIHLVAKDAAQTAQTAQWFHTLIHAEKAIVVSKTLGNHTLDIDNVAFSVFAIGARFTPRENDGTLRITDNSHLDHIAFSFRDLDAAYRRIEKLGVERVGPMATDNDYGFRHFFVRAPNGVLVELVEGQSWPQAAWER